MVHPWKPERLKALHSFTANQNVLERVIKCVADVQRPRDVRGRNNDRVGQLARRRVCGEIAIRYPLGVERRFAIAGDEVGRER
ncbi:unannotated protein [freshwater metagenome]|uniref:Unannotated protein n=1 Tax=freshwater metagenome TaxID=449393 RepID=A0A6J7VI40_9ZZZZ